MSRKQNKAISPARKVALERQHKRIAHYIRVQKLAVARRREVLKGPTESWWTCPPEEWAAKAKAAAERMGAVTTTYRIKQQDY